jgi:hydrogenase maturation protein HypF
VRAARSGELDVLRRQLERSVACVPTSSMGRLFDAVASLLDLRHEVTYEAQAAIGLEALAAAASRDGAAGGSYSFGWDGSVLSAAPVLAAMVDDLRAERPAGEIALAFHVAVAEVVAKVAAAAGMPVVGLTGGVFQNVLLTRLTQAALRERGLEVLTHRVVPPNDGGLALGQAAVAAARLSVSPEDVS